MIIIKFILWCIIQKLISDIFDIAMFNLMKSKNELKFNRIKNYIPEIVSHILIVYLLIKDSSTKTIFLGLLTIELIRFIFKIVSYKYITVIDNKIYLNNEKVDISTLVLDFSYRINPKCFFVKQLENKEIDISNIYIRALVNNKAYLYYDSNIINGFKVLVNLKNNYKFKYIYNGRRFDGITKMLVELTKNVKEDINYCLSKNDECDKDFIIEIYSKRVKAICKSLEIKDEEIDNILKHIL